MRAFSYRKSHHPTVLDTWWGWDGNHKRGSCLLQAQSLRSKSMHVLQFTDLAKLTSDRLATLS